MIIDLTPITDRNAHAALIQRGHKEYTFIGHHRRDRNLLGSPLAEGPSNLLQYRQWLWSEIQAENPAIHSALRKVALSFTVVHEETPEIAALIERAARWYKEKVLMPQIVCRECLVYLTDANAGEYHLCKECAWSGRDDDGDEWKEDISWFCSDCSCILSNWTSQMYGQCEPCKEKKEQEALENFNEEEVEWIPYRPNFA